MGFWGKVKGVFGRIGKGIKNVATKAYNWITDNKDKIKNVAGVVNDATGGKYSGQMDKAADLFNKGSGYAQRLGII